MEPLFGDVPSERYNRFMPVHDKSCRRWRASTNVYFNQEFEASGLHNAPPHQEFPILCVKEKEEVRRTSSPYLVSISFENVNSLVPIILSVIVVILFLLVIYVNTELARFISSNRVANN